MRRLVRTAGYVALLVTPAALLARALLAPGDVSTAALGLGGGVALGAGELRAVLAARTT